MLINVHRICFQQKVSARINNYLATLPLALPLRGKNNGLFFTRLIEIIYSYFFPSNTYSHAGLKYRIPIGYQALKNENPTKSLILKKSSSRLKILSLMGRILQILLFRNISNKTLERLQKYLRIYSNLVEVCKTRSNFHLPFFRKYAKTK